MRESLGRTVGASLLTGWTAEQGVEGGVTQHAVDGALVDRHVAVCGSALPVVDRRRPWVAETDACCEHCLQSLMHSAA